MKTSTALLSGVISVLIICCSKDETDPLAKSLINTKWELDKIEIYNATTNDLIATISTDLQGAKKVYFKTLFQIQLQSGNTVYDTGCGSWKISNGKLITKVNYGQIIPSSCAAGNFLSYYRNNNSVYKIDDKLVIEGLSGGFDFINPDHQYWAMLLDGELTMLSYYKQSENLIFLQPPCCEL